MPPRLFLNHDAELDWLIALEFGVTDDGQPGENWEPVSDDMAYLVVDGRCVGFVVKEWSEVDPDADEVAAIWAEPFFDVPVLGLRAASAGEIILSAASFLDGQSTVNRLLFSAAIGARARPEEAVVHWKRCLQTGDVMAHYGLGYTLLGLGRVHEAYRHLRAYTEITPSNAWAWCWFGQAADAIGEASEAESAYRRALELEEDSFDETDADELLDELLSRRHR